MPEIMPASEAMKIMDDFLATVGYFPPCEEPWPEVADDPDEDPDERL